MNWKLCRFALAIPASALALALLALVVWWRSGTHEGLSLRLAGADQPPGADGLAVLNPVLAGQLIAGQLQVSASPAPWNGSWPQFRGPNRDGISQERVPLARSWEASGPHQIWSVDCGEGYAGVAVCQGRVYLLDYDRDKKQGALRCLSLTDGNELWRYAYPLSLKRNHGMTRTVPAVSDKLVVALDSKCNVLCLDALTGELRWALNLVHQYGTTIPPWYAGQCPLIDGDQVILAPGGRDALLVAVDLQTGKPLWRSPNPRRWKMTHSSIMPMEWGGQRFYVYCGSGGVAGISARDGSLLWETTAWKISIATIPSPLVLEGGKLLLSGGYNAGSLLLQLREQDGKLVPEVRVKLPPEIFGATQHTPILYQDHIYGTRPNGQFTCLDQEGKVLWTSPPGDQFGLGPFLLANGLLFVMNDSGRLSLLEAAPSCFTRLAQAQVLTGHESWAPMALADGRLLVRDFRRLACLEVGAK